MTLAIMQPYLFPYLGYFQLIQAVDRFVVYDDVNFIKQGWINRNRILVHGGPHMFTLPLSGAGSFTRIDAVGLGKEFVAWRSKFLKTLEQVYRKAPCYAEAMTVVEGVLAPDRVRLVDLLVDGLRAVMGYVGIDTELVPSSSGYGNQDLSGESRILDICRKEGATDYVNPAGGKELYSKASFAANGVHLWFIKNNLPAYTQFGDPFQPGLSVLDAMMFVPPGELGEMVADWTLE